MTLTIPKVLCLSMALIFGDVNLILLGLIVVSCAKAAHSQFPFGSTYSANSSPPGSSSGGSKREKHSAQFYQRCEKIIKRELKGMRESSLSKEVRLIGTASTLGGPMHFYSIGSRINYDVPLFSWKSKTNAYVADDIIVLGMFDKNQMNEFMPLGWMSGAFVVLRKFSDAGPSPFMAKLYYYALVAYVRKDYNGSSEIVEWDRFSPKAVKNLFQRETDVDVGESFTIETLLCSYGTCACAACKCGGMNTDDQVEEGSGRFENSTTNTHPSTSKEKSEETKDKEEHQGAANAGNESKEESDNKRVSRKRNMQKRRKFHGVANAIAKSSRGSARSKSEASERGKWSLASSIAGDNAAVAEAISHKGGSQSYAESRNDSLAEATGGKEGASSSSVTRKGAAQSSAQSRGGEVAAEATSIGSEGDEYNYYDTDNGDSEEDFDGKSLIRDTNQKFAEANQRADKMKLQSAEDYCLKESGYEVNLTLSEFKLVTDTDFFKEENQKMSKREHPSFLYRNPSRFGIDVETGLNSSVLIATVIPGFVVPRESCCGLDHNSSSAISKFLRTFRQDCNSDLETQVKRLQSAYKKSYVDDLMKTKRLSLQQLRDLVPMILLRVHEDKKTRKAIKHLNKNLNSTASERINKIVALIVNGAHYAVTDGIFHKIKIFKGLVLNVRTVLTGVLLEYKRCKKDASEKDCSEEYYERLKAEKKLILGLYYFLKFADGRYAYYKYRASRPMEVFVGFMKTHSSSLSKLDYCKSRRIIMNSA